MKIASIIGARPQFIKAAAVSEELRKKFKEVVIHTGQHYDVELSAVFFNELDIPAADYNLGIGSDTHARQTGRMMSAIEGILLDEKPDLTLVYGDTNSTLAAALAAVKVHIPVAHVESGPRMFDKNIPEEINRVLTDHCSKLLFAPTKTSVDNLYAEGIRDGVFLTGDVMLDSFLRFRSVAERKSQVISDLGLSAEKYLLATLHRAVNTDNRDHLENITDALISLEDCLVFPIHPRTEKYLREYGLYTRLKNAPNILLTKPVGYLDSIILTANAKKVLTDSGGLQKEAYFARVPCITLDQSTAWVETVEDGWNTVVGWNKGQIIEAVRSFKPEGEQRDVFGDGRAAEQITGLIGRYTL